MDDLLFLVRIVCEYAHNDDADLELIGVLFIMYLDIERASGDILTYGVLYLIGVLIAQGYLGAVFQRVGKLDFIDLVSLQINDSHNVISFDNLFLFSRIQPPADAESYVLIIGKTAGSTIDLLYIIPNLIIIVNHDVVYQYSARMSADFHRFFGGELTCHSGDRQTSGQLQPLTRKQDVINAGNLAGYAQRKTPLGECKAHEGADLAACKSLVGCRSPCVERGNPAG